MCCFCFHFSDFNVFFQKKIKILLQFTFEKNNLLCKKREKNNSSLGKIPAPPLDIKWSVPYLCPLGLYAALFHPTVECILNLQGLFKSEVPVVIFLHLVLKMK